MRALNRLSLPAKLTLGFGLLIILSTLVIVQGLRTQEALAHEARAIYDTELLGVLHLGNAMTQLKEVDGSLHALVHATTPAEGSAARATLENARTALQVALSEARQTISQPQNLARLEELALVLERKNSAIDEALSRPTAENLQGAASPRADELLRELSSHQQEEAREAAERIDQSYADSRRFSRRLLVGALLVGPLAALLITLSIRTPIRRLSQTLEKLAAEQLDLQVPYTDYPNEVGVLARAIEVMQSGARTLANERWVKANVADLSARLQQAATPQELAQSCLAWLAPLLEVGAGAFYLLEGDRLQPASTWCCSDLGPGDGLVRQCATEKTAITLNSPPADYLRIRSGLGQAPPRCVMFLPVQHSGVVLGVLELATFKPPGEREQELLRAALPGLGVGIHILARNLETRDLLADARAQAYRMEVQAARLEEQTAELDAQRAELSYTHALADAALENSRSGYWHAPFDDSGEFVSSERTAAIFGDPPTEGWRYSVIGHTLKQIEAVDPAAGARALETFQKAMSGETPRYDDIYPYKRPADGRVIWVHAAGHVKCDENGKPIGIYGVLQDITERRENEGRLAAQTVQLKRAQLLAEAALGLTRCGTYHASLADEGYFVADARAREIWGFEPRPDGRYHIETEFLARVRESDPQGAEETWNGFQEVASGEAQTFESSYRWRRPNGQIVHVRASGEMIRDQEGDPVEVVGIIQELSVHDA